MSAPYLLNRTPCFSAAPIKFQSPARASYTEHKMGETLEIRNQVPYDLNWGQSGLVTKNTYEYRAPAAVQAPSGYRYLYGDPIYPLKPYDESRSLDNSAF